MTDRRRNVFVLLLVAGLLAASLAYRDEDDAAGARPQGRRRARLPGASRRPQQPKVTPGGARPRDRHHARARRPARRRRAGDPALRRRPDRRSGCPTSRTRSGPSEQVGKVAQLFFYDWEKNVLGPDGKPDADDPTSPAARRPATSAALALRRGQARLQAPAEPRRRRHDRRPVLPVRPTAKRSSRRARSDTRGRPVLRAAAQRSPRRAPRSSRSRRARSSSRPSSPTTTRPRARPTRYFVLNDDPALNGTDIKNPEQNFDQGAGGTGRRSSRSIHRTRAQEIGRTSRARSPSAACRSSCPGSRPTPPSSTSRPRSTTSSSPRRSSTTSRTRTGSTAATARRSRAASRSRARRTSPTCSRPARCRSSSS